VAVEASEALCREAALRFDREVASGQLTVVNAAIAAEEGPVTFYANEHSPWGTTVREWADRYATMGISA
jgi:hypothetical protein